MKRKVLPAIRETTNDFDGIEAQILKIFRQEIYLPLLKEISLIITPRRPILANSRKDDNLDAALRSGRVQYFGGRFTGRFSAGVSRELSKLGAKWDGTHGSWNVPFSKLPGPVRAMIGASDGKFKKVLEAVDRRLGTILPKTVAENVKIAHLFDRTLFRIDATFEKQVKGITVVPKLSAEVRRKVAEGYTLDLQRYIEDFTGKEMLRLRRQVQESALSGNRYEGLVDSIQSSYGVSERKAKFLARQETALMMTTFKRARYQEAGLNRYRWECVVGSPKHPVRPMHQRLNGKEFSWDSPPITDDKGGRNHPGQDYNCRCVARPIVTFK